jgi:hypothetical protein
VSRRTVRDTPTPGVWEKRLQAIENKGNECRKERKERRKRRQEYENNGFATEAQSTRRQEFLIGSGEGDTPGILHGCEKKGVAEKGICKSMKTKGRGKNVGSATEAQRHEVGGHPPPRVFCTKSVDLLDSKGVDSFESAKEFVRVSNDEG